MRLRNQHSIIMLGQSVVVSSCRVQRFTLVPKLQLGNAHGCKATALRITEHQRYCRVIREAGASPAMVFSCWSLGTRNISLKATCPERRQVQHEGVNRPIQGMRVRHAYGSNPVGNRSCERRRVGRRDTMRGRGPSVHHQVDFFSQLFGSHSSLRPRRSMRCVNRVGGDSGMRSSGTFSSCSSRAANSYSFQPRTPSQAKSRSRAVSGESTALPKRNRRVAP